MGDVVKTSFFCYRLSYDILKIYNYLWNNQQKSSRFTRETCLKRSSWNFRETQVGKLYKYLYLPFILIAFLDSSFWNKAIFSN
jgi:hypothetical protein